MMPCIRPVTYAYASIFSFCRQVSVCFSNSLETPEARHEDWGSIEKKISSSTKVDGMITKGKKNLEDHECQDG